MPVANTQPVHSVSSGDPINATWGVGVAESVLQRFDSAADRDANWITPPDGAMCYHDTVAWVRRAGKWEPAFFQTYSADINFNGSINGSGYDFFVNSRWPGMPVYRIWRPVLEESSEPLDDFGGICHETIPASLCEFV